MIKTKIKGVLKYARIIKPVQTKFGADVYQLTLSVTKSVFDMFKLNLSENEGLDMTKYRIPHKVQDDGSIDLYFQVRAKGRKKDGEEFDKAPKLIGKDKKPIDKTTIGNGSQVVVDLVVFNYDFEKDGKTVSGIQLQPKVIQVNELVKFEPKKPILGDF